MPCALSTFEYHSYRDWQLHSTEIKRAVTKILVVANWEGISFSMYCFTLAHEEQLWAGMCFLNFPLSVLPSSLARWMAEKNVSIEDKKITKEQ